MSKHKAALEEHSIVIVGDFNPKIFQPAWFALQGLIRPEEAEEAEIKIIHADVVAFSLKWMSLDVTRTSIAIKTTQSAFYEVIRDLFIGTFDILEHTPLKKLGINLSKHFVIEEEKEWHRIGDSLAPKDIWKKFFKHPGMRSLTIEEAKFPNGLKGYIRVLTEPSEIYKPGVFFRVNDHYEVNNPESVTGAYNIISALKEHWGKSINESNSIIDQILEEL